MVRLSSGKFGSCTTRSHASRSMVPVKRSISKAGLALHRSLGRLLDPAIDRRDHLRARVGLGLLHAANRTPHRVDLDALSAVLAAQVLVEEPLEAALAHHLAAPVTTLLELLVAR